MALIARLKTAARQLAKPSALSRLLRARDGVGAVEFALIVPILLIIYLMSFEITVAISITRKTTHASSDIADLVTQKTSVDKAFLSTMPNVAKATIAPYASTGVALKISGITIDAASVARIAWSWQSTGGVPYAVGSTATIPSDLAIANSFVVRSELSLPYSLLLYLPGMSGTQMQNFTIKKDFYYRQRVGNNITCSDC
ncbi:TadE/TadG family type IV pilus assembly protein [Rhizobium sp. C4]|uniref:TadE/TadG family type IV pilus assembly protein n=1 Tax=Rhizobium sp. C4 TaxID=1349800 RepID=UPI001E4FD38C|nr:TadE/TadG family type IV pilus assembly protein [Rhizobium sp. C4]MCD2172638.1 pilus assembly protein [Rhizobium sp. C4]